MASATLNGIDLAKLQELTNAMQDDPQVAQFNFRVINQWVDGTHNRATVQSFSEGGIEDQSRVRPLIFEEDEPPVLMGGNQGANPVEYLLVGLSGCLTTSLIAQATAAGVKFKSVQCKIDGNLDARGFFGLREDIRAGYQQLNVTFEVDSDESPARIQELVKLAQEHSPVFDIVTHPVPVSVKIVHL